MLTGVRFDMSVTPKRNRPSFCLILKLSHALDGLFSVLSRLHGSNHKCAFCWMKKQWTLVLLDNVARDSFWYGTHYFVSDIDPVTTTFHVFVNTYFLIFRLALLIVLKAFVYLIYQLIFNKFLLIYFWYCTTLSTKCLLNS